MPRKENPIFSALKVPSLFAIFFLCVNLTAADVEQPVSRVDSRLRPQAAAAGVQGRALNNAERLAAIKKGWGKLAIPARGADRLRVRVDAVVTDALLAAIRATGANVTNVYEQWNSVYVDATLAQIDALGELPDVRLVKMELKPRRRIGTVTTQGDASHRADQARTTFNVNGFGQRVGVISDTVNRTAAVGAGVVSPSGTPGMSILNGTTPQNNGNLPSNIRVVDFGELDGTDEGTGMLEIVYDLAPGAELAFGSASNGSLVFADSIIKLRTLAGCTVTTDDIGYFEEPFYSDGPIAKAITQNYLFGIPHFSAAGNDGDYGIQAQYADINPAVPSNGTAGSRADFHNFGIGGGFPELLPFTIQANAEVLILMQWDQPFASYGLGAGSAVDLNLFLYDNGASPFILDFSKDQQGIPGSPQDPAEGIYFDNTGGPARTLRLGVDRVRGANANFRIVILELGAGSTRGITFPFGGNNGPTIFGHPSSAECIAVGAVPFFNAPSNGTAPGAPEDFTGRGGVGANGMLFLNPNGSLGMRDKPEIAAVDGANTSAFGDDDGSDGDTFPNFYGTSAAAPHAAGIAALIKSRATVTPAQLLRLMQESARDVTLAPAAQGLDDRTGRGLIDALSSIQALPAITLNPVSQNVMAGSTATFTVAATGGGLMYQWRKNGMPVPGANSPTYTTPPTAFVSDNNAFFHCIVSNVYGQVESMFATLTVQSAPVIIVQPSPIVVNLGTTATFSVNAVGTGTLTYQWKRGTQNIPGATAAAYAVPSASLNDDGAQFSCVVTNTLGSTPTQTATLTINTAPSIAIAPVPTPNPALTGQSVTFTVTGSDPQNQPLTVTWTFGDGSPGFGGTTTHVYQSPGTYNGTVRVTDPLGLFADSTFSILIILDTDRDGIADSDDSDDDGDNVSDELEALAGTSTTDKNSTPFGGKPGATSADLDAAKLALKLSFTQPLKDSISLSGTLPIPDNFVPLNERVTVSVGGVIQTFDLDEKGRSLKIPAGSFKTTYKAKKGVVSAQIGKYALKLSKGTFAANLADEELTDVTIPVKKESRTIRIVVFFAQQILEETRTVLYTAKPGSGSAK